MSRLRILFLGTPEFASYALDKMLSDEHFEIVAAVTQPDRPAGRNLKPMPSLVKILCEKNQLRCLTPQSVNTEEFLKTAASFRADSAVVVAYGQILKRPFLDLFPLGCVNLHASLLPKWRGAAPIQRAIMNDDKETGVSLQLITEKLDAGKVLGVRRCPIQDQDSAIQIYDKLKRMGAELLQLEYMDYLRGNAAGVIQDETKVSVAPKIQKAESRIDWTNSARHIFCQIRGLTLGPHAFFTRSGKTIKIHEARMGPPFSGKKPGDIHIEQDKVFVVCGKESLQLLRVQPEAKTKMSIEEYMRGYAFKEGEHLQ